MMAEDEQMKRLEKNLADVGNSIERLERIALARIFSMVEARHRRGIYPFGRRPAEQGVPRRCLRGGARSRCGSSF